MTAMLILTKRRKKEGSSGGPAVAIFSATSTNVSCHGHVDRADMIDEKGRCTSCGKTGIKAYIIDKDVSVLN
jgi:hypothetical protein